MSGHRRLDVAAVLLFAGLSSSPALSNPLTDLFNPPPQEAPAPPAPAKETCLLQPGSSAAPGQHWVYHHDGHRKCWFQAEAKFVVKKPLHHYPTRRPVAARDENEAALRKKPVADARAQLLSDAPVEAPQSQPQPQPQPTSPAPEVVDAAPVPSYSVAAQVPAAPVVTDPMIDRLAREGTTRRPVDVEMLLAAASPATLPSSDTVASSAPAASPAPSFPDADDDKWESVMGRAGMVLIGLGLVFLVGSLLGALARREPARMA